MLNKIKLRPLKTGFSLRHEQQIAIDQVRTSIRKGHRKIVLHMSTAVGKTVWAGMLFYMAFQKNPQAQCWFVVNRNTLLEQAKDEFETFFGFDCAMVQGQQQIDLSKHVQIATIQTLHNRLTSDNPTIWEAFNRCDVPICVIDESHLDFKGYRTIADAWNPLMIGLTGTPFTRGMAKFWKDMVRPSSMVDAIARGTLCDYRVKACVSIDRDGLSTTSTGEYKDSDVEEAVSGIIGDVYAEWAQSEDMKGRPFLGFAQNIATCIALANTFTENGVSVGFVHSKMSDDDCTAILESFKNGYLIGVFSVIKLIEGFNYPAASALLMCAPLAPSKSDPNIPNSANRYVQQIGRVLRSHASKDGGALIHDHTGNYLQYGPVELIENYFPALDNGEPKKEQAKPEERLEHIVRECAKCGMVVKGAKCSVCGFATKKPTQFLSAGDLEYTPGEMVEVKRAAKKPGSKKKVNKEMSWDAKVRFFGQLKKISADRGYAKGWAANQWRNLTGVWPNDKRLKNAPLITAGANVSNWVTSQQIAYAHAKKRKTA